MTTKIVSAIVLVTFSICVGIGDINGARRPHFRPPVNSDAAVEVFKEDS